MTKVRPTEEVQEASTSKFHSKGIEALVTMAAKLFGAVSRKWERRQSTSSSDESIESGMAPNVPNMPAYTQSSTRKLAFGTAGATEEHKPLDDFYNNSTLTNFSKLFCAIVLLTAFFLVMSRSLQFAYEAQQHADFDFNFGGEETAAGGGGVFDFLGGTEGNAAASGDSDPFGFAKTGNGGSGGGDMSFNFNFEGAEKDAAAAANSTFFNF